MAKYAEKSPEVLKYISEGYSNKEACGKAGISEAVFYVWLDREKEFLESFKEAKKQGDRVRINSVEAALFDIARGFEYEEVRTEYESQLNQVTGKFEPVIKKQVRTKKRVVPNSEAIKFFLSNKAPNEWKNRMEQTNLGQMEQNLRLVHVTQEGGRQRFPSSEDEVDAER